ncbi:hypothetical protein APSETT444_005485 [Aspergillus pseudonomiae]
MPHCSIDISSSSSSGDEDSEHLTVPAHTEVGDMVARHVAAHFQALMLLTIRLASIQVEDKDMPGEIRSDVCDIDGSERSISGRLSVEMSGSDRTSQSTYHPDSLPHVYCEDRELLSRNRSLNSEGFEIEFRPALVIVAMEPGRNTGEARTPTLAERARKTVTRTRGFVHDSRQNVASGARTVGHNIRMAVGRAAERMVDNLHVLFPGLIRHPVGSYLKRAYGEFTVLELRDGVPYRNITAQSESRKIVTSFLRSLRLSYRFIPDVQGEPWYLDVADNINRLVAEADAEPLLTMVLPEANQTIQADVTVGDTRYRLQCQVDYVLWYGFKADADMLLIIITPKAMDEVRFAAPLAAMWFARMTELQVERTDDTVYDPIHQIMVDLRMPHPHPDVAG